VCLFRMEQVNLLANGPCLLDNLVIELYLPVVMYVALPLTLANC